MMRLQQGTVWLAAYLAALVVIGFVHSPLVLGLALGSALLAARAARWQLFKRTLLALALFNATVSAGYALVATLQGNFDAGVLLVLNLRVVLMTFLGFWFVQRNNLLQALAFAPGLRFVATLAAGQASTLQRAALDAGMALKSRHLGRPDLATRSRQAAAQAAYLLDRGLQAAAEQALALRSRGVYEE